MNKLKTGDYVEWDVITSSGDKFTATGRIIKIYETTFGGCLSKLGAKIFILNGYPYRRKTTTVSLDKLRLWGN